MNLANVTSVTDFQGFERLRADAAHGKSTALTEAAQQFEALFIGMMLKSARQASLGEGLGDSSGTRQYMELMDQQVAMDMARGGGFGFADMIVNSLAANSPETEQWRPESPSAFVHSIAPHAQAAAERLGIQPELIMAQAALETGWGSVPLENGHGGSTFNLFGIKADSSWSGARIGHRSLEVVDGVGQRRHEQFRAYPDMAAGFDDYVKLMQTPRYAAALEPGGGAESYVRAITEAGYATDPDYADKWLGVLHGRTLREALGSLKLTSGLPTN